MDKARSQTDHILEEMERKIGRIYENDPALKHIRKEYAKYMAMVNQRTKEAYNAYINETDVDAKKELKDAYEDEIRALTLDSKEYKKMVDRIASVLAEINQKAVDITNAAMNEVYAINYNQVAEDCRKAGIKING